MLVKEIFSKLKESIDELDARVLIKCVLGFSETDFWSEQNTEITKKDYKKLLSLSARRLNGEPIAYLVGHKEFFGLDFLVHKNVLIPRPESEFLVEHAIEFIRTKENGQQKTVLDVGTGSGNIIISLYLELYKLYKHYNFINFFASDISPDALKIAKKNATVHEVDNIQFVQSNLFKNISPDLKFDLIIANLPYVPQNGADISTKFEPETAIFTDDNGAAIIKKFLVQAKEYIKPCATILIELDPRNALKIKKYAEGLYPSYKIELQKDLASLNRYLTLSSRV